MGYITKIIMVISAVLSLFGLHQSGTVDILSYVHDSTPTTNTSSISDGKEKIKKKLGSKNDDFTFSDFEDEVGKMPLESVLEVIVQLSALVHLIIEKRYYPANFLLGWKQNVCVATGIVLWAIWCNREDFNILVDDFQKITMCRTLDCTAKVVVVVAGFTYLARYVGSRYFSN